MRQFSADTRYHHWVAVGGQWELVELAIVPGSHLTLTDDWRENLWRVWAVARAKYDEARRAYMDRLLEVDASEYVPDWQTLALGIGYSIGLLRVVARPPRFVLVPDLRDLLVNGHSSD